jgi:hypothetical protein
VAEPHDQRRVPPAKQTENARRASGFKFARERIEKIVAAAPPLTDQQRAALALILTGGGDDAAT